MLPTLTHLEVLVVEAHDLAASKLLRGNEHRWALFHFVEEVWGEIAALDLRPSR